MLNFFTEITSRLAACGGGDFLGFPTWHKYLDSQGTGIECVPVVGGLSDIWLIVLAIIDIMLRIAAIAAIIFVIVGAVRFIVSDGNPEKISSARRGIIDALIGLIIAILSIAVVNFLGGRF